MRQGTQRLYTDRIAQPTIELTHPHEGGAHNLFEPLIRPNMVYINGFNTDSTIACERGIELIDAAQGNVIDVHQGPFRS